MMTESHVHSGSARASGAGNSRLASSSSPWRGRTTYQDAAREELRLFLSQLFRPDERIWFFPLMRQEVVNQYVADPVAFARLEDRGLVWDKLDRQTGMIHHLPLHCPSPPSTTLKSRRFDSVIAKLRELNSLRYDV